MLKTRDEMKNRLQYGCKELKNFEQGFQNIFLQKIVEKIFTWKMRKHN